MCNTFPINLVLPTSPSSQAVPAIKTPVGAAGCQKHIKLVFSCRCCIFMVALRNYCEKKQALHHCGNYCTTWILCVISLGIVLMYILKASSHFGARQRRQEVGCINCYVCDLTSLAKISSCLIFKHIYWNICIHMHNTRKFYSLNLKINKVLRKKFVAPVEKCFLEQLYDAEHSTLNTVSAELVTR